jgi:hypothetical protein
MTTSKYKNTRRVMIALVVLRFVSQRFAALSYIKNDSSSKVHFPLFERPV